MSIMAGVGEIDDGGGIGGLTCFGEVILNLNNGAVNWGRLGGLGAIFGGAA